jgi:hypothetical protein
MLLGVVEGAAVLQVLPGRRELAEILERLSERPVRVDEERRVADALGQAQKPLGQLARRVVLG